MILQAKASDTGQLYFWEAETFGTAGYPGTGTPLEISASREMAGGGGGGSLPTPTNETDVLQLVSGEPAWGQAKSLSAGPMAYRAELGASYDDSATVANNASMTASLELPNLDRRYVLKAIIQARSTEGANFACLVEIVTSTQVGSGIIASYFEIVRVFSNGGYVDPATLTTLEIALTGDGTDTLTITITQHLAATANIGIAIQAESWNLLAVPA